MTIGIKDTLVLDDHNEYVVISKINYDNKEYYYLIDINNDENILFCYEDNDELVEVVDKKLVTKMLPSFLRAALKEIYST